MSIISGSIQSPMNPLQASLFVEQVTAIGRTPLLLGPPGVGKTDCVYQAAKRTNLPVFVRLLSQLEPSDFIGLPCLYDDSKGRKRTKFATPDAFDFDQPHFLFFDEFAQADIAVQRAASEIVLQHTLGGIPLHPETRVVAASNRKQDRAGVTEILGHNKSRMITANVDVDHIQWGDWAAANGVDFSIIAYITTKGKSSLLNVDLKETSYPCPRTWVMVSDAIAGLRKNKVAPEIFPSIVAGSVGHVEASAFLMFRETFEERPSLSDIIESPETAKIPKKHPDQTQVASMIIGNLESIMADSGKTKSAIVYTNRLSREAVQAAMKKAINEATSSGDGAKSLAIVEFRSMVDAGTP